MSVINNCWKVVRQGVQNVIHGDVVTECDMEGHQRNRNCPCVDTLVALTQAESVKEKAYRRSALSKRSCATMQAKVQDVIINYLSPRADILQSN